MSYRSRFASVLLVSGLIGVSGCSGESSECDRLRDELETYETENVTAEAAWQDIQALQEEVTRMLLVRDRVETECGGS
jgi:hypothetical protein